MIGVKSRNSLKLGGITLMLIPHSQKKIFKLRINLNWFFFVTAILLLVCTLSAATIMWHRKTLAQKQEEQAAMNIWDTKKWLVYHNKEKILEKITSLNEYGNEFYNQIWDKALVENPAVENVYNLDSENFRSQMMPLEKVILFIIQREESFASLPLGWPVKQGSITSDFGDRVSPFGFTTDFHSGSDFANAVGTPIYATADGEVAFAGNSNTGYGYYVKILHKHGFLTLYGHASKVMVYEKQQVKRGDLIALMGRSGSATGPHVHYEVRQLGLDDAGYPFEIFLNPLPFIKETW